MVTAPFNNTVAPVSSWARFALANGFNRTSSAVYGSCESACSAVLAAVSNRLSSFAISPACGVITTWPGHTLRQQVECAGIHHDWRHVVGVLVLILAAERVMLEQCGDGVPLHIAVGALDASLGHRRTPRPRTAPCPLPITLPAVRRAPCSARAPGPDTGPCRCSRGRRRWR